MHFTEQDLIDFHENFAPIIGESKEVYERSINNFKKSKMKDNFVWTDELVKEMIWRKLPIPDHYCGNVQKCLDEYKASKQPKKDWEIVEFKHGSTETYFTKAADGNFYTSQFSGEAFIEDDLLHNKLGKTYLIHAVRRISDGEIFSVGDNIKVVTPSYKTNFTISRFYNTSEFMFAAGSEEKHSGWNINSIQKVKEPIPLFTDSNGLPVYAGGATFGVAAYGGWDITKDICHNETEADYLQKSINNGSKIFSTKEAAEEYILMNKPALSINDFVSAYGSDAILKSTWVKNIKEIAQSKINNNGKN